MKTELLKFINDLIKHDETYANSIMTDEIKAYLEVLATNEKEKPEITDNGKIILKYMQDNDIKMAKSKDIAVGLGYESARGVSGSIRKLVSDGFVEKIGKDPAVYALTEKGRNYKID